MEGNVGRSVTRSNTQHVQDLMLFHDRYYYTVFNKYNLKKYFRVLKIQYQSVHQQQLFYNGKKSTCQGFCWTNSVIEKMT